MIGLVACSAKKHERPAPARELYCSPLFRLSIADAIRTCTAVYVMSAKHGLVELDQVIAPYNDKLPRGAWQWARTLLDDLEVRHPAMPDVALYGGANYIDPILTEADNRDAPWVGKLICPLVGMQIGQRLQWLSQRERERDRARSAA